MARILVIDDEPSVMKTHAGMLMAGGHAVIEGRQGSEIWTDLAAAVYDVVLSDLQMPLIDGWEIASWVNENRPGIPVVAVSGFVGNLQPAQLRIFHAVLSKPVRLGQLLDTVSDVLQQDGHAAAAPMPVAGQLR